MQHFPQIWTQLLSFDRNVRDASFFDWIGDFEDTKLGYMVSVVILGQIAVHTIYQWVVMIAPEWLRGGSDFGSLAMENVSRSMTPATTCSSDAGPPLTVPKPECKPDMAH